MTLQQFIQEISDEHGPLQTLASDALYHMQHREFIELINEMKAACDLRNAHLTAAIRSNNVMPV